MSLFNCRVSGLVINSSYETLLIRRNNEYLKDSRDADSHIGWEFCGGGIEYGETPEEAVEREYKEETGIKVKAVFIFNSRTGFRDGKHLLNVSYVCKYMSGEIILTKEHIDYKWVPIEDLGKYDFGEHLSKDISKFINYFDKYKEFISFEDK